MTPSSANKCSLFLISVDSFTPIRNVVENRLLERMVQQRKKLKKVDKKFVNRNGNVVPLQSKDWTRTGLQPTFVIFQVWGAVHVASCRWERSYLSPSPSKSQSGWDSWRKGQRENKTAKDSHSFFDRLTYPKKDSYCSVTKFVILANLW